MPEKSPYIQMMVESLQKKLAVMDQIVSNNEEQTKLIRQGNLDLKQFGELVESKDKLVQQLAHMDQGFQALYDRMEQEFVSSKALYKDEIRLMQQLILQITEKSMLIQTEEARIKLTIEAQFAKMKREVKQAKKSTTVAANYYKSMSRLHINDAQFMDQKK